MFQKKGMALEKCMALEKKGMTRRHAKTGLGKHYNSSSILLVSPTLWKAFETASWSLLLQFMSMTFGRSRFSKATTPFFFPTITEGPSLAKEVILFNLMVVLSAKKFFIAE